jgi:hypothetical protein
LQIETDYQINKHWSQRFGVSKAELRIAVKQAGPMVKDVEA